MNGYKRISVKEAKALLEELNALLIDIRDQNDYEEDHEANALHLSSANLSAFVQNADKDTPLVVVCYHGNSSRQAAAFLSEQGFSSVYSVDGGYEKWKSEKE